MADDFIQHPRINDGSLESRTYQEVIAASATDENTLCVLPTGLGKTAVAILLAAQVLEDRPGTKTLMLAPTRPLVEQHRQSFERALDNGTGIFEVMTGDTRPEKREEEWREIGSFFATPQVVENDIIADRIDLDEFSLVVFDECHKAVGEYPYKFIAQSYLKKNEQPRILGLTASPGGNLDTIRTVADNLHIGNIEVRTEEDSDVRPYVQRTDINWLKVGLDRNFKRCKKHLEDAKATRTKKLKNDSFLRGKGTRGDLLKARKKIQKRLSQEQEPELYRAISLVAGAMKVDHALELLETQGVRPLYDYLQKMKKDPGSKAAKQLLNDEDFQNALAVAEWMYRNDKKHPKAKRLKKLVQQKITKEATAIVFTQYRDSVDAIHDELADISHVRPVKFKGQKDGFTQQRQLDIIEEFRDGEHNVLVSTSVGEEGLDIPAVDYVIFYEPIPSEIRTIQRRGRTGRQERGSVYVLMAENTRDEAYYWSSKNKEKKMQSALQALKDEERDMGGGQQTMDAFSQDDSGIIIYADDRENAIMKKLSKQDVTVRSKRLEIADFLVSDRTAIERKTTADFVDSIIDNRLFTQVKEIKEQFEQPLLIIEGDDLYSQRNVHPNAIRGALASIAIDYKMPVLWTDDVDETVDYLVALAKREQEEQDRGIAIRGKQTPKTEQDLQKFIVAGLPNVSDKLAERLLEKFGSVRDVFAASAEALKDVEGIGEGKAKRIKDILDKQF